MTDRLFFALWPDAHLRSSLSERVPHVLEGLGGKPQRPDQWHVTLEFLGPVPESRLAAIREAADRVRAEPFEVTFDAIEHWRRPQVLCLVARALPPALQALVSDLRAGLAERNFEPERRPFRAHLTLTRKLARPMAVGPCEPLCWRARDFALVESITDRAGSVYSPLATWPLDG